MRSPTSVNKRIKFYFLCCSCLSLSILKHQYFARAVLERMRRESILDDFIDRTNKQGQVSCIRKTHLGWDKGVEVKVASRI